MVSLLAQTPWLQFNPLSLMNSNKGVFGVNLGHMWGEVRPHAALDGSADGFVAGGRDQTEDRSRVFTFDEAAAAHHFIQDRKNIGKVLLRP